MDECVGQTTTQRAKEMKSESRETQKKVVPLQGLFEPIAS